MKSKYFTLYLMLAFGGLFFLACDAFIGYSNIGPGRVLLIAIPDLIFFYLAYKNLPEEKESSRTAR